MLQYLRKKYTDYKVLDYQQNNKRSKKFVNWADIQNIVLLYSADKITANHLNFLLELFEGKNVSVWGFSNREIAPGHGGKINIFGKKDINLLGKPSDHTINTFKNVSCDVLIDLCTEEVLPVKYLLSLSNAPCKCGLKKVDFDKLYDLEVSAPANTKEDELLKLIIFYLKAIKSK
ncbi:MAG: hypothetical protein UF067_01455 [Paludibacteraceae bacterium]|nr:hypothetical protein [Paludibacteraceae bacterium]